MVVVPPNTFGMPATSAGPSYSSPGQQFDIAMRDKNALVGDEIRAEIRELLADARKTEDTEEHLAVCKGIELLTRALGNLRA